MTSAPAIATSGLVRRFGAMTVVDQLNLRVPRGSVYCFLGPNGAGKTTTIRMLLGLIRPDAGETLLFGESLHEKRIELLGRVGALVESPALYPHLTGRENLEVYQRLLAVPPAQVDHVLATVDLRKEAHRLVQHYSLGMRQRLGLAMSFLNAPDLLILDEPSNGLDPAGMRELRDLLCNMPREHGVTVFISSHLLNEVEQIATHIGIINKGRLTFQGTPEELRAQVKTKAHLDVDRPDEAMALLARDGWVVCAAGDHDLAVVVECRDDLCSINTRLVHAGMNVYHLGLESRALEDVFLTLTASTDADGGPP